MGVILIYRLIFHANINAKVSKANRILELIRTITFLDEVILVQLPKAFGRPLIEISNCVWSLSLKKCDQIIENVQRRATMLVSPVSHLCHPYRFTMQNLPTFSYI